MHWAAWVSAIELGQHEGVFSPAWGTLSTGPGICCQQASALLKWQLGIFTYIFFLLYNYTLVNRTPVVFKSIRQFYCYKQSIFLRTLEDRILCFPSGTHIIGCASCIQVSLTVCVGVWDLEVITPSLLQLLLSPSVYFSPHVFWTWLPRNWGREGESPSY